MTTFYPPPQYYYHHQTDSDFDLSYGGEGDSGRHRSSQSQARKSKSVQVVVIDGNTVEITPRQRRIGIVRTENYTGTIPGQDCEVFCGKIPRDIFEGELLPLFAQFGQIWDLRLMINPVTLRSRGYAFVKYMEHAVAKTAARDLDNYQIRPGKCLTVTLCKPKVRLFVGNIPKVKGREELMEEFARRTEGLVDVIVYNSPDERKKNRGFCFLEYATHKQAYLAKKKLFTSGNRFWGCDILVDWADPMEEPDDEIMSQVKVLYVRNLTQFVSQDRLRVLFQLYGCVERVKKIKDYAFIHFQDREGASRALNGLNGQFVCGTNIEVTWAKPPTDKKKREGVLRARERRTMQLLTQAPRVPEPRRMSAPASMPLRPDPSAMMGGFHPNYQCTMTTGRGDFNEPWGCWGSQTQFPDPMSDFYPFCPYLNPRYSCDNYARPLPEDWQQTGDGRPKHNPMLRQPAPATAAPPPWVRRTSNSTQGLFGSPSVRGIGSVDEDNNWRAKCGPIAKSSDTSNNASVSNNENREPVDQNNNSSTPSTSRVDKDLVVQEDPKNK